MDTTSGAAPLLSLDAVDIDAETTGLDPRKARVVELAGVRLSAGKLVDRASFVQLLRPADQPIPTETTRIHGIDDATVAESPPFVMGRSTSQRLAGVKAVVGRGETDLDALDEAHGVFLELIVAQQIADVAQGTPPSNAVLVKRLSAPDRERLRAALEAVTMIDDLTRDLLFRD